MTRKSSSLVPQNHFAAKCISHHAVLAMLTWLVVILIGNIMIEEMIAIINHFEGDEIAHEIFKQEQTISILLVGLGVLLEGRQLLLHWVMDEETIKQNEAKNLACEYYGFLIISVGLLIELIDQFLRFALDNIELHLFTEFLLSYPLNIYALYLLISVGIKLMIPIQNK